jgi:hypothetical chaperone protein
MATVMPYFGLGIPYKDKPTLNMPKHYFVDLATWHQIHRLYEPKILRDIADLKLLMQEIQPIERLLTLLKQKDGHRLAGLVEQAKIDLSEQSEAVIDLSFLNREKVSADPITHKAKQADMAGAIDYDVQRVFNAVNETLTQSGIKKSDIHTIFTTGGSTALPSVKSLVQSTFPDASWVSGDLFNSVGKGLVLEAAKRYR